MLLRVAY